MRKIIAGINMTLDGFCDHTAAVADEELHDFFTNLLRHAGLLLYGRTTFQLMEYWRPFVENPSGERSGDEFAIVIDQLPKLVFSRTMQSVEWPSAKLATRSLEEEVRELREQPGKDILVGSPSLIAQLTELGLIDEYQLCVHPVILGKGLPLFKNVSQQVSLNLTGSQAFKSGAIVLNYVVNHETN